MQSNPSLHPSDTVCPSSLIWVCTGSSELSRVNVIDANMPGEVIDSFPVCSSPLLCIASVPGVEDDGMCSSRLAVHCTFASAYVKYCICVMAQILPVIAFQVACDMITQPVDRVFSTTSSQIVVFSFTLRVSHCGFLRYLGNVLNYR